LQLSAPNLRRRSSSAVQPPRCILRRSRLAKASADNEDLTHTGDIVGTLRYMAPERFQGQADVRADIYSLGLTLYEMLTLCPAFQSGDQNKLIQQVMHDEPERPRKFNPVVPHDLETIVLKAIDRDPARRYQNAAEMSADLNRFVEDRPILARRVTRRERLWRWCRRNPAVASLLALLFLVLSGGLAAVTWKWREAEHLRQEEQTQREAKDVALGEKVAALKAAKKATKAAVAAEKLASGRADKIQNDLNTLAEANKLVDAANIEMDESRFSLGKAVARLSEAIRVRPDLPHLSKKRAEIYARLGLWDLALEDYGRARSRIESAGIQEWFNYGLIQRYWGDIESYRKTCRRMAELFGKEKIPFHLLAVCALDPDPVLPWSDLIKCAVALRTNSAATPWDIWAAGLAYYRAGDYQSALGAFQHGQKLGNWNPPIVLSCLALTQHKLNHGEAARQTLRQAEKALDEWITALMAAEPGRLQVSGHWVELVAAPHLLAEAKELLDGVRPSDDPRWWVIRGRSLAAVGRLKQAQAEFARAIKARPRDADVRMACFRSYVDQKQWDKAELELAAASRLKPDDAAIWSTAFNTYAQQGQRRRADAALEQWARKSPQGFMVYIVGFKMYANLGDLVAARAAQDRATAAAAAASIPDANVLSLGLALWHLAREEWDKAEAEYQRAAAKWPKDGNLRWFYAYQLTLRNRDYPKVVGLLEEATRLKPDNAGYWNDLGNGHMRMENFEKASEALSRAIQVEPKIADYWANRGNAKAELGRWKEAAADYARAAALQPSNSNYRDKQALWCLSGGFIAEYKKVCAKMARLAEQFDDLAGPAVKASQYREDSLPKWSRLLPIIERQEAINQKNPSYYVFWAIANYHAGNFAEAQRKLVQSAGLRGTPFADDRLFQALTHHQLGNAKEARRALKMALQQIRDLETRKPASPGSPPTRFDVGQRQHFALLRKEVEGILNASHRCEAEEHLRNREWAKAIPHLDKLIEADPNFWPDLAARGDCHAELGDLKKALADYDKAVALDRAELAFNKLYWRHGLLCLAQGDKERFRKVRERLVKRFGESKNLEELWELAANCRFPQAGVDPKRVLAWMEKASSSFLQKSSFQFDLAVAHFRAGQHDKALKHLQKVQEIGVPVDHEAHLTFYLALVHHQLKHAREARKYCDQGVEWFDRFAEGDMVPSGTDGPTSWPTRVHLLLLQREVEAFVKPLPPSPIGRCLREKRWANALALLNRRLAAEPKSGLDLKTRALCHLQLESPDKAAADFARLAKLQPDDPDWLCKQAVVLLASGNRKAQGAVCDKLVDRFGVRDKPSMASRTAYACVLAPDGVVDPTLLVTIAQRGAGDFEGNERIHGAALYRAGKCAEALERFAESAKKYEARAWDWLFVAMAHHRLGHVKEGRKSLTRAQRWIAKANGRPPRGDAGWGWWGERIEVDHLLLEAEALLKKKRPAK
jgi:tetratricopeptide (TPR) repeat protein